MKKAASFHDSKLNRFLLAMACAAALIAASVGGALWASKDEIQKVRESAARGLAAKPAAAR